MVTSIAIRPNAMAATRKLPGISSAGMLTSHSASTYSSAGRTSTARNAATASSPKAWTAPCTRGDIICRKTVRRRCSLRCTAMQAPSMASHRKAMETTSSIHTTGSENT